MSAGGRSAYDEIVAAVELARGTALLARRGEPPDPHEHDLPIRHPKTGQIMAYIPAEHASGLQPVILHGLVVGYYKDTPRGRFRPVIRYDGTLAGFSSCAPGEEWSNDFTEDGESLGGTRIRTRLF